MIDCSSLNAPTGARGCNLDTVSLCDVLPSPTTRGNEPKNFDASEDGSAHLQEFEFETSRRFVPGDIDVDPIEQAGSYQVGDDIPDMAFADELFSNGRMMPLKPPPRLRSLPISGQSSAASSPKSSASIFRLFSPRSFWSDDSFDPFSEALRNVQDEKRRRSPGNNHRRARSLSPFRVPSPWMSYGPTGWNERPKEHSGDQLTHEWSKPNFSGPMGPQRLPEPKGVEFARYMRLVNMVHEEPIRKPRSSRGAADSTAAKTSKRLLLSLTKEKKHDVKPQHYDYKIIDSRKPNFLAKCTFRCVKTAAQSKENERSQVSKMTLLHYRNKMLQWLSHIIKSSRYI